MRNSTHSIFLSGTFWYFVYTIERHLTFAWRYFIPRQFFFWQNDNILNLAIFSLFFFIRILCSQIVHTLGIQLVPELLLLTSTCKKIKKFNIVSIFLPISFNICFWVLKRTSHWDCSFEYLQHMFWLEIKKTNWYTLWIKGLRGGDLISIAYWPFFYPSVADPEGIHPNPPPCPPILISYESEIIWSQWDQIISFLCDI